MNALNMLRELASSMVPDGSGIYSPRKLRFVLEVATVYDDVGLASIGSRLESLLASPRFQLESLFQQVAAGSSFLVLAFPGVECTLPPDILYQIAGVLRVELGLISCEPDTGEGVFSDPDNRPGSRSEAAVVDAFCMAAGEPPTDRLWALKNIRATDAWAVVPTLGRGIRIAQLDTGITGHLELADAETDLGSSLNLMEGGTNATDPLRRGTANPGHGTATGSAAVSTRSGAIAGAAPGATLIPIRCIDDVKVFDASPIAKGIEHAIAVGAHIITMSLGGIGSRALERIIGAAVAHDIIVVAAAGNCVGLVVWPAAYPDVIAVGGSGPAEKPWRGTSFGAKIEFSAPAEFVWVADRRSVSDPLGQLNAGQGTSFATALTAGAAALWLARFGRDEVIEEARRRGVSVQALFRAASRQTCRVPMGWETGRNGSGVLDCKALVDLPLTSIHLSSERRTGGLESAMETVLGPGQVDAEFDWAAHGAEVSGLLIADSRAGGATHGGREGKAFRLPSEHLSSAARATSDRRMAGLVERRGIRAPSMVTVPNLSDTRNEGLITGLGQIVAARGGQESIENVNVDSARQLLGTAQGSATLTSLEERLRKLSDPRLADLVGALSGPIDRLRIEGPQARLSEIETVSLEALVELKGRPAIPVTLNSSTPGRQVQTVDGNHPELGRFQGLVNIMLPRLEDDCLGSVGRIDADGHHIGTGFLVAPGLVLTNRHVLQHFASPVPSASDPDRWLMVRTGSINFSPAADDPASRFIVREVVFAGPDPIYNDVVDFTKLDLALLRVDQTNPSDGKLPKCIRVDTTLDLEAIKLFVVGYPAPPDRLPLDDIGRVRQDVVEALRSYYGISYGHKFFSPGSVKSVSQGWWFDHDATTLAGNSGSLVCNFANIKACGLHFAGDWLKANQAHGLAAVLERTPGLSNAISSR